LELARYEFEGQRGRGSVNGDQLVNPSPATMDGDSLKLIASTDAAPEVTQRAATNDRIRIDHNVVTLLQLVISDSSHSSKTRGQVHPPALTPTPPTAITRPR
jgi:hypothetical protein